ncbi:FixH family protein [Sporosarcina sp. G11-34]|nr:FixH family protein [Sporosarcina sp. G11-34]
MVACSKEDDITTEVAPPEPLKVELTVTESVDVGETVNMEALVTQGDEKVEDASEVVYEIWEEGKQDESEMIDSVNEKQGIYSAESTFDHDGTFHIQVHVTARGLHTMPKATVIVGDGGHYEEDAAKEDHHETEGFSMNFMKPEGIEADSEQLLHVQLELDAEPLEDANVRYEIWREGNPEKHEWVDAEESTSGEYSASYTFLESDTYTVVIHVEDDEELHEHSEYEIKVGK